MSAAESKRLSVPVRIMGKEYNVECPPDELTGIGVVATMLGGRWVHGGPPFDN